MKRPEFLTVNEASRETSLPSWLLRKAITEKRLVAYQFRAAIRILRSDLKAFVEAAARR